MSDTTAVANKIGMMLTNTFMSGVPIKCSDTVSNSGQEPSALKCCD